MRAGGPRSQGLARENRAVDGRGVRFVALGDGRAHRVQPELIDTVIGHGLQDRIPALLGDGVVRIWVTTNSITAGHSMITYCYGGNSGSSADSVYAGRAQLEAGAKVADVGA